MNKNSIIEEKNKLINFFFIIIIIASFYYLIVEIIGGKIVLIDRIEGHKNIFIEPDHRMSPNQIDTNSDGIRSAFEADYFKKDDYNIIFLGDSFVYGMGLYSKQSLPMQFESIATKHLPRKKIKVANYGWITSSPLLSYRLLKDIGRKYNPDLVVLCIDMTDFSDDIRYEKLIENKDKIPFYIKYFPGTSYLVSHTNKFIKRSIRKLKRILITKRKQKCITITKNKVVIKDLEGFFITNQPLKESLPYLSYIRKNIENINLFCKEKLNSEFILIILPRSYQYSKRECPKNWEKNEYEKLGPYVYEPFKYFESIKENVDYPIYSLLPNFQNTKVFPTCFNDDPHWNEQGTNVAAQAIFNYLKNHLY